MDYLTLKERQTIFAILYPELSFDMNCHPLSDIEGILDDWNVPKYRKKTKHVIGLEYETKKVGMPPTKGTIGCVTEVKQPPIPTK